MPLISIIMAVHNCEATLESAVASISDQTYPNWELIICDDASTDGTGELLQRLAGARDDGRIVFHRSGCVRRRDIAHRPCGGALVGRKEVAPVDDVLQQFGKQWIGFSDHVQQPGTLHR